MTDREPARPGTDGHENGDDAEPSRRGALIALGVVVALLVAGVMISQVLHSTGRLQDCVMSGRSNCAPIQSNGR